MHKISINSIAIRQEKGMNSISNSISREGHQPIMAHIGYVVKNLEDSMKSLRILYGVKEFVVYDFIPVRAWSYGKEIDNCTMRIAMGGGEGRPKIEIIQPLNGELTPQQKFINEGNEGIHHICLQITDYNKWRDHFAAKNDVEIVFEAQIYDEVRGYRRCMYIKTVYSNEIVEYVEVSDKPLF